MATGDNASHVAVWSALSLLALAVCCGLGAEAAPSIEVRIGFNGHVVAERYAPVHVDVRGYVSEGAARIVVSQLLGSGWRGTATVRQELDVVVSSDGSYRSAVPIYDPLSPIGVSLVDASGRVIAEATPPVRLSRHSDPFSLLYGTFPIPIADDEAVTTSELPTMWWALDAVRVLWIATPPPQEAWPVIAQWVLAGGTVLLASGPDYFRYDSPVLRDLLPLDEPTLVVRSDGELYLTGAVRPGASILVSRDDVPIVFGWTYGAGHLAVLAVRPPDLTDEESAGLVEVLPDSTRLSLTALSQTLLSDLPVARPTYLAALFLIAVCLAGFTAAVHVGRRWRRPGAALAVSLFAAATVLSGFLGNATNGLASIYRINTSLYLEASVGISIVSMSFYSPDAAPRTYALTSESVPIQMPPDAVDDSPFNALLPQTTTVPHLYEHTAGSGRVISPGGETGRKTFCSYGPSPRLLRLTHDSAASLVILENQAADELVDCWLLVDGRGVALPPVSRGTSVFALGDGETLASLAAAAGPSSSLVLQHLTEELPLQRGVWFVALSALEDLPMRQPGEKVRHLEVYVVKGGTS